MIHEKEYKMKIFNLIIISFLIFNGCAVEHQLSINLDAEEITIDHVQSRDFNDLPFFIPESVDGWEAVVSTDVNLYYRGTFGYDDPIGSLLLQIHVWAYNHICQINQADPFINAKPPCFQWFSCQR